MEIWYHFFFIFAEAGSAGKEKFGTEVVVLRLVEGLPKNQNLRVFFDNWFSTLSLICQLRSMGILATGTFRSNRIVACQLMAEKDLKNEGHGIFDYRIEENTGTYLVESFDNKCVMVGFTYAGVEATTTLERRKKKFKSNAEEKSSSAMS